MEEQKIAVYGDRGGKIALLQPVFQEDIEGTGDFGAPFTDLLSQKGVMLVLSGVKNWNQELSPWEAPAVFGGEAFGDGAEEYLQYLKEKVIFGIEETCGKKDWFLAGYSLAGLFSLWAATRDDTFRGVAGVSPSVWFPGWTDYVKDHPICAGHVYLSLGQKEEKTKNPVMSKVGEKIRELDRMLMQQGISHVLEWNPGNHFADYEKRMQKAMNWLFASVSIDEKV